MAEKEYVERCVDCLHHDVCRDWATDCFGADTQFPYEYGNEDSCVGFKPTADVVEVRHGRVMQLDHDEWWGAIYKCCECNGEFMLGDKKQAKCCPYCGAYLKMDGKGDGE